MFTKDGLYAKIREQICYYFSFSNVHYDRYMGRLVGFDPKRKHNDTQNGMKPVKLSEFLNFNKIRSLTQSYDDLLKAFDSTVYGDLDQYLLENDLRYNVDNQTLQRTKPYDRSNENLTNRTVYIEGFDTTIKNIDNRLRTILQQLGPIQSIRMKRCSKSIGYAFIEFKNEQHCQLLCDWFDEEKSIDEDMCDILNNIEINLKKLENKTPDEDDTDRQIHTLRILSKGQWNTYKNRYLRLKKRARAKAIEIEKELREKF